MTVLLDGASKGSTTVIVGGLHASATSNVFNGARADTKRDALGFPSPQNRFWFEFTNNFVSLATDSGSGITNSGPNYAQLAADATNGLMIYRSGAIWLNGVNTGRAVTGGIRFDSVIFAVNLDTNRLWAKTPGNAFWLDDVTADPDTGVLGIDISSITGSLPGVYPVGLITSLANSFDFNAGGTLPVNTPPSTYGPWQSTPPTPAPTLHAIHNARMQGFATHATAIAQGTGIGLTLLATEPADTFTAEMAPSIGMTLSVTEVADGFQVVPPGQYNVGGLNTPNALADDDIIYVLENNETLYVEGDFSSSFVIPSEDTMYAV